MKHYLWPGNSRKALERLGGRAEDLERWDYTADGELKPQPGSAGAARMLKYVRELEMYIRNNAGSIAAVTRAAATRRGRPTGPAVPGIAGRLTGAAEVQALAAMRATLGGRFWLFVYQVWRWQPVIYEVQQAL